jgi:membrane protein YqaA with SNARE-associated domain
MQEAIHHFFLFLLHLGAGGLLLLGMLDSSFLFLPLGNDLLLTALTVQHKEHLPLYIVTASVGSTLGVLLMDLVVRRGGEVGLQKLMSKRRFEFLKRKMSKFASVPVALVCVAPPPFPFTPVVAAASAFNYPRIRLLGIVFVGRILRFTAVGLLAAHFGTELLQLTKAKWFVGTMIAIIAISIVGSVMSVLKWVRQSKQAKG